MPTCPPRRSTDRVRGNGIHLGGPIFITLRKSNASFMKMEPDFHGEEMATTQQTRRKLTRQATSKCASLSLNVVLILRSSSGYDAPHTRVASYGDGRNAGDQTSYVDSVTSGMSRLSVTQGMR